MAGYVLAKRWARVASSAAACDWLTPDLRRPAAASQLKSRALRLGTLGASCSTLPSGIQNSGSSIRSRPSKARGSHSDDGKHMAGERDGFAKDRGVGREPPLP